MKNLLNKGKVIVSCISVLAILAVSLLSMFTGVTFIASAEGEATEGETTVTYPLNGSYDADVTILEGGISYEDVSGEGTVSDFTEFDPDFWRTAEGNGTAANPYIVETANQFAAVATAYLTDADGKLIDTTGMSFKVADGVKAFNMNNTESTVDFSGDMTAAEVEAALADAKVKSGLAWSAKAEFKGRFDGNGVVVYGLKSNAKHYNSSSPYGGLFQVVNGVTIRNLTVKNCYFWGDSAGGLVGYNQGINPVTVENCSIYNNVGVVTRLNEGLNCGGIIVGRVAYVGSTAKATISNCLIYGNDFKHSKTVDKHSNEYDIKYGLVANFNTVNTYTVKDSIILDAPCYSIGHGHNAFHASSYFNIYTNMVDVEFTNTDYTGDGSTKLEHVTAFKMNEDGSVTHTFNKFTNGVSNEVNYSITYDAGKFIKADSAVKGSAAKDLYTTLDPAVWSFDGEGYPTPRIYKVREYSAGEAWSGEVALFYSGGSGTKDAPYQIATAEELALMMTTMQPGECFVLTADIIINDTSAENWTDTAKKWFTSNDTPALTGTFNGNGHTVSGIYFDGTQAGEYAGLIPVLGSNAAVKNVTIANSVLNGKNGAVGAVAGATEDMCAQVIKTNAVVVEDTVKFDGNATKGGIIGKIGYSAVKIEDCLSKSAGLYGEVTGQANIKRSVSVGAYPFTSDANVKAENVYTDTEGLTAQGVTVVANADMLGAAAETSMAGLGFPTSWKTVDGSYPAPTGAEASADGVAGDVWSGAVASKYEGGTGTKDDPYLIATGEQLARFVTQVKPGTPNNLTYYKLTADIYLNDVEGNLWKDKVGCTEWYTQRTSGKGGNAYKYISFDGDGHVVFGMYINQTQDNDNYYRAGLMPYLSIGSEIKNVGISEAYLKGDPNNTSENIGGLVGVIPNWHADYNGSELLKEAIDAGILDASKDWLVRDEATGFYKVDAPTHEAAASRIIQWDPDYNVIQPDITNCFVDHTCYISGYTVGGLVGTTGASVNINNCAVTASIEGADQVGGLIGSDWGYLSTYSDCISLPQTCNKPAMGSTNSDWRNTSDRWVAQVYQVYYFSIQPMFNDYFIKISDPLDRVGTAARNIMTGLDWDDTTEDGTQDLWRMVDGGTPVLTVFAKHRSDEELEKFSDKSFAPPEVTVTLSTGTDEVDLEPLKGRMYSKITLPIIERDGYEFTGWYAFSDLSVKYPIDYFPPRSLTLYAGWEPKGIIQNFESYTETIWDNDSNCWQVNKPGAKGGYKNAYVRNGSKSMHLLGTNTEPADCLLNYEEMLKPGTAYTITFWVTTDTENNPATLLSLVHNSKPDYLNSAVAVENMAVATGLKVGKWEQYSYSFTAQTKWISIRATAGSSLYFDDIMIAELDGTLEGGKVVNLGTGNGATGGTLSPNTSDAVSVAVLISAVMACAVIAVISRKNLVEIVEE